MSRDVPPARRRALDALALGEQTPTALAAALGRDISSTRRDLMILRSIGMVTARRDGNRTYYAAVPDRLPGATAARTDPKPVAPAWCTCRHLVTSHERNGKGMRMRCTSCGDCRVFVSAKAVARA